MSITFLLKQNTWTIANLIDSRFVDDALGFALTWNYWFNDAVSTASDIIALQLLLQYWTDNFPGWAISLIFLVVVIALNVLSVRVYGEVCVYGFHSIAADLMVPV